MSSTARTVILGSWARTWKRMRVGYVGTPETSFLDSILLVELFLGNKIEYVTPSSANEYVTHFLLSSFCFLFCFARSQFRSTMHEFRVRLDIGWWVECAEMIWEWCRVSATGSLRITERIIESIKPVKWETAASLTAHISFVIECLLAQRIIWVVWMGRGENNDGGCDSGRDMERNGRACQNDCFFGVAAQWRRKQALCFAVRLPIVILHFQCPPFC